MSILTPVFNPPEAALRSCAESVRAQTSPHWQWCIVNDASTATYVRPFLDHLAARDPRIRVEHRSSNGGIVEATNDALRLASLEIVTFLDHDDELTTDAVEQIAVAFAADESLGIVYSDEVMIDAEGAMISAYDKPDLSVERLRGHNYICHIVAVRRDYAVETGGLRAGRDGAQDYDFNVRAIERFGRAAHIPKRLYRWRAIAGSVAADPEAKPAALVNAERTVREHCDRLGIAAGVTPAPNAAFSFRLRRTPEGAPLVSILTLPAAGTVSSLLGDMLREAQYSNVEVLTVEEDGDVAVAINRAADEARGDILLVVCRDVALHCGDLIGELLPLAQEDDVAAVGPMVHLADGRVGANGLAFDGGPRPVGAGWPAEAAGPWGAFSVVREVSAVPAVCFAAKREVFRRLGGLTPGLPEGLVGADYGQRAQLEGLRVLVTPFARVTIADDWPLGALSDDEQLAWWDRWGPDGNEERFSVFDRDRLGQPRVPIAATA